MIKRSLLKNFTMKKNQDRLAKVMSINKQEKNTMDGKEILHRHWIGEHTLNARLVLVSISIECP